MGQEENENYLSRGMVQRLGMAMLMTRDADIMILDEPASGLDPNSRVQLRRLLKDLGRQGKAILISSHILNELEDTCTHMAIMDRGRLIVEGTIEEIRRKAIAGLRYRIRFLGTPEAALAAANRVGAVQVQVDQGNLTVEVTDEEHIARINAALVAGGIPIIELRLLSDLEDAFVKITTGEEVDHDAE